jgi:RNA polymerase sigma-70 factor, ECF subfamily
VRGHRSDPLANPRPLLRQVYAFAAYRLGPGADAEEVVSEVLERALRYRSSYDPKRGTPLAWMLGIARRVVAEQATAATPVAELPDVVDPVDHVAASVERMTMDDALDRLPERDRELLALRYGADLKASQIAEVLDMQVNAVEVALHRALARLRAILSESDGVSADHVNAV